MLQHILVLFLEDVLISINKKGNVRKGCPYCSNQKVGYGNDFKTHYPELLKYWDYEKNKKGPDEFVAKSNREVWWICNKNHNFKIPISRFVNKSTSKHIGCKYCSNQAVGFGNDLKSIYPELKNGITLK